MSWTSYGYDGAPSVAHTVTYSFVGMSGGVGRLVRTYVTSSGVDEQAMVGEYIYYEPADTVNSSKVSFQDSKLAIKLTSRYGGAVRSSEYGLLRRPTFF